MLRDARRFNIICSVLGLLFLIGSQGFKWVQYERRGIGQTQDFDQYYMGGVSARHGEWGSIYPIPNPGSRDNPGESGASTLRPRTAELARRYGVSETGTRFMQPPPAALLFVPLTVLPFKVAHAVWIVVLCLATWGIAHQAGRAYTLCSGRRDVVVGLLVLFVCLSLQAHRWVRVGNFSAIAGWIIGYVGLSIATDRQGVRPAAAMVVGAVAKYVTVILAPVHLAARHWRTLAWTAAIGIAFLLGSLLFTGVEPYRVFAREIAPTLDRPVLRPPNASLVAFAHRVTQVETLPAVAKIALKAVQWLTLAAILWLLWRGPRDRWREPANACAACVALLCWMLIFAPILWEHYFAYLAPFWGWMVWEAFAARGTSRWIVRAAVALALAWAWFPQKVIDGRFGEPVNSFLLWSVMLTLVIALRRIAKSA